MTNVKTLLLTRPEAQSRTLANDIETNFTRRARCIIAPLMAITPFGRLPDTTKFQALLFTSINGVKAFAALGGSVDVPCYCVGERTAAAAQDVGLTAISANGAAADLVTLMANDLNPTDGPLLYVRGENTTGGVAKALSERGFSVQSEVLYQQKTCELSQTALQALAKGEVNALPLYSPLTARRLANVLTNNPEWPTDNLTALCISENVASEVRNVPLVRIEVAFEPNGAAMLTLISQFLR